jgi:hypothetical protein
MISDLRSKCERLLCRRIDISNVIYHLQLADLYRGSNLKEKCFKFIAANFKEVKATQDWADLKSEFNSKIILEEMISYMTSNLTII